MASYTITPVEGKEGINKVAISFPEEITNCKVIYLVDNGILFSLLFTHDDRKFKVMDLGLTVDVKDVNTDITYTLNKNGLNTAEFDAPYKVRVATYNYMIILIDFKFDKDNDAKRISISIDNNNNVLKASVIDNMTHLDDIVIPSIIEKIIY